MKNVFKRCACGREYTEEQWKQLRNPRLWRLPWGEVQELRECECNSTISVILDPGETEGLEAVVEIPAWIRVRSR